MSHEERLPMSRSTTPKFIYYRRAFLNKQGFHGRAYVLAEIRHGWAHHTLTLADCSHQIRLEFPTDQEQYRNSLYKANMLAQVTAEYRDALQEAIAERKQLAREYKASGQHDEWPDL